jgi:hypothetical protein
VSSGPIPTLATLHRDAAARWGDRVSVRLTFDGREYTALAQRTTATGAGVEEVRASTGHATPGDALCGLALAMEGT